MNDSLNDRPDIHPENSDHPKDDFEELKDSNGKFRPEVKSDLRGASLIETPKIIRQASGILIQGRRIKSFLFSTDVSIINYSDADAILAIYPGSPHPAIIHAVTLVASQPVIAGVGGGLTSGKRSAIVATFAEAHGVMGVVVNSPASLETIQFLNETVDCPIIGTVVSYYDELEAKMKLGVDILNVAAGKETAKLVRWIRERYPQVPIIATGGSSEESIRETIDAGANAISWTPPTNAELFRVKMEKYRADKRHDFMESHDGMTIDEYEQHK